MADKYQGEVSTMLHKHNIFTRHEKPIFKGFSNGKPVWLSPERSTPDLVGGLVHQVNVEVKICGQRFDFDRITKGQYEYAKEWRKIRGCEYWFAIMFSALPYAVHGRLHRDLFLIPFPVLESTIKAFDGIQKGIPHRYLKGMKIKTRDKGLFATKMWAEFRLEYFSDIKWCLPMRHPFAKMYLNQKPYLYE